MAVSRKLLVPISNGGPHPLYFAIFYNIAPNDGNSYFRNFAVRKMHG
jgi:hypothetical protein